MMDLWNVFLSMWTLKYIFPFKPQDIDTFKRCLSCHINKNPISFKLRFSSPFAALHWTLVYRLLPWFIQYAQHNGWLILVKYVLQLIFYWHSYVQRLRTPFVKWFQDVALSLSLSPSLFSVLATVQTHSHACSVSLFRKLPNLNAPRSLKSFRPARTKDEPFCLHHQHFLFFLSCICCSQFHLPSTRAPCYTGRDFGKQCC